MFRKSALAMAMLGAFASTNVVALGLGEIELKSALNQPLDAEVELLSATAPELEELKVAVASAQAFADAGIDRPLFLNRLQFNVGRNASGQPVVRITSREVVREPFLDFLLEMSWSKGRLVREYTVLVDPPVTMPAPPPVTSAPTRSAAPAIAAAPAGRVTHTAQMPPVSVSPGEYGPTRRNDTLWSIAEQVRPDSGVSVEQTMLGLLRANPEAFIDNNINNLKAGYVLRVPDRETLTSISRSQAAREARAQYNAWRAAQSPSTLAGEAQAATAAGSAGDAAAGAPVAAGEPSLQLVAPDAGEPIAGAQNAEGLATVQQELMMANEALEEQRRQSEEMSGRLSMLEEQIANMQRLIQLKDNELAQLQAQAAGDAAAPVVDGMAGDMAPETASADMADAEPAVAGEAEPMAADMEAPVAGEMDQGMDQSATDAAAEGMPGEDMTADAGIPAGDAFDGAELPADATEAMPVEESLAAPAQPETLSAPEPAPAATPVVDTLTSPGLVDRLLANPLYLGGGAALLVLLGFLGLRRKRGVETEFQESILQAATASSDATDSEIVSSAPDSTETKTAHSSLLSEFAVSDMGSIRNDGEADPLAEADVYLAYGRYQQAEDLISDALAKDDQRDDLHLKLLEVYMAARNSSAFDHHAQALLARLGSSSNPTWEKVAEMGRELSPGNPIYQEGAEQPAFQSGETEDETRAEQPDDEGLDFDMDLSYSPDEPDSAAFEPSEQADEAIEPDMNFDMDSVEPDALKQNDEGLEFDLDGFDIETAEDTAASGGEEEMQGDGELADLDEVSTKLDLARAYIDMGDPDGARSILDEVMEEGSDNQKEEARGILAQIS